MHRLTRGQKLVVATHNKGKLWEINQLIAPYGLEAISAGALGLPEPEETETTFEGNARLKAEAAAKGSGLPALADDSGLEVACLGGAPGIYSARWAGPAKDFAIAMRKVAQEVTARHGWSAPGPRANFISVLCLAWPDGEFRFFEGRVDGHLAWPPRGGNGFGYDPMFIADGETETFGEMEPSQKYAISHRTRAFDKFRSLCLDETDAPSSSPNATRDADGLAAAAANISTREELQAFVGNLGRDLAQHPDAWSAATTREFLASFEEALHQWPSVDEPRWRTIANLLLAAAKPRPGAS